MRIVMSLAFVLSQLAAVSASAAEYDSVKTLLLKAIDATGGTAHGVVVGPVARKFSATTGSTAPVVVEVTTLKSFAQEGCKRLNVRLKQANVPSQNGMPAEFGIDYQLNLCRDGGPPTEGMDLDAASRILAPQAPEQ